MELRNFLEELANTKNWTYKKIEGKYGIEYIANWVGDFDILHEAIMLIYDLYIEGNDGQPNNSNPR